MSYLNGNNGTSKGNGHSRVGASVAPDIDKALNDAREMPALAMVMRGDQLALHRKVSTLEQRIVELEKRLGADHAAV